MCIDVHFGWGFAAWQISSCYNLSYIFKVCYECHIPTLREISHSNCYRFYFQPLNCFEDKVRNKINAYSSLKASP